MPPVADLETIARLDLGANVVVPVRRLGELPAEQPKAVLCAGGLRSSTVISALKRHGVTNWFNVTGGMGAWVKAGYGVERSR